MENEIVVRNEYWKCQLSVKRKLHIPISTEEVLFAYKTELYKIGKQVVIAFDRTTSMLKDVCEILTDVAVEMFDNWGYAFKVFKDNLSSCLDIDEDYNDRPVLKKDSKLNKSKANNLNLASKSSMKRFNMQKNNGNISHRCRNNLRK